MSLLQKRLRSLRKALVNDKGENIMSCLMIGMTIVTTIATAVIAYYAWRSHKISEAIIKLTQKRDDDEKEFKQQIKDLYQAIVVSNIVLGPEGVNPCESSIQAFKRLYKGNTKI